MTVSGSIYFLGKYRPVYFEGANAWDIAADMMVAIRNVKFELRMWIVERIEEGRGQLGEHCTAWSADHCDRGVSFAARPHDPWLDATTANMPPCPGLDYSRGVK